jgi:hypothetical protein
LRIVVLRAFTESLKEMTDCQRLCRRMSWMHWTINDRIIELRTVKTASKSIKKA